VAVWRQQVFSLLTQVIVEVHATRNLSQGGVCYILIQMLKSRGQLLMSGARPVAGRLGPSGAVWIVATVYIYSL
jgi:hypothetical protein